MTPQVESFGRFPGAVVLAGGRGRRLGRDKAGLTFQGRSFLAHAVDKASAVAPFVAVALRRAQVPPADVAGALFVEDAARDQGPLSGMLAGFRRFAAEGCDVGLVMPCDLPLVPVSLLSVLVAEVRADCVAAVRDDGGRWNALLAAYPIAVVDDLAGCVARGELAATAFLKRYETRAVAPTSAMRRNGPAADPLLNVNTPDDLARLSSISSTWAPVPRRT